MDFEPEPGAPELSGAAETPEVEKSQEVGTAAGGRKHALARMSSMPTPCRSRRLAIDKLQAMDGGLPNGQLRRRPSESSCDHSWLQLSATKECGTSSMTPSTRTPSPAPSLRSLPFSQSMPSRVRRPSRTISRSSSEVQLLKQPGEEVPGLEDAFWRLCASNRGEVGVDCRHFDRLCKDAGFLDTRFTTADADLVFTSITGRGLRRLDAPQFESALRLLAFRKCLPPDVVFDKFKSLAAAVPEAAVENFSKTEGRSAAAGAQRAPTSSPPPPTPPLRRTPSLTLLETPPRHRQFTAPTLAAASAAHPPSRRSSSPARPHTAPWGCSAERFPAASTQGRLKPLDSSHGSASSSRATGSRGSEGAERELLLDTFASFCWGKADMDGRGFARLCRDCRILDSRFTALDADLLFTKVLPKGQRRLSLENFDAALTMIAERRKMPESAIRRAVAFCHGPLVRATQTGEVRLHDDKGGYTGTHVLGGPEPGALGAGTVASIW
eukprot:gb/GFBE01050603.1/.p1 GENE.gb/GFBE01050603.1/~~gb/GFBE01050603.1/.p1  ORF type:complete len:496 (+),score=57.69 gb/GFBE01050603.1/:1-1488(+)